MSAKRTFPWALIAAAAVAGASFVGVANAIKSKSPFPTVEVATQDVSEQRATPSPVIENPKPDKVDETADVKSVHVVERDKDDSLHLGKKNRPVEKGLTSKESALNQSFKSTNYGELRALGVSVDNGVAIIDMNNKINEGFGSNEEAELINVFKQALSQFPDVKSFQIRVDGQILDSLGHSEMTKPISVR
jgi:hypothetical protein